tara:strand:+ start:383 stop:1003 length:621 start_codon:yes stop_codon:yes gene_type:complete
MFWWLFGKKAVKKLKDETKSSFKLVKKDLNNVENWIRHFDSHKETHKNELKELRGILSTIKEDVEELKKVSYFAESVNYKRLFKTPKQVFKKQTGVYAVQTGVQTGVQTPNLDQFSITERAIIWALLNTDLKLSYEDLAAILGKEKATIRGQINSIKQKNENIIEEIVEQNGKKRVFIPENIKEKLLKKAKVRVKGKKKLKKIAQK